MYLDFLFYIVLLISLIWYVNTDGVRRNLLRMSFAIILFSKAIGLLSTSIIFFTHTIFNLKEGSIPYLILHFVSYITWVFLSFYVLRLLSSNIRLKTMQNNENGRTIYEKAPKAQRLVHYIIDGNLAYFICSSNIFRILAISFSFPPILFNEEYTSMISVVFSFISSLLFYTFFESVFGATPAKLLTGTRVIQLNGRKIGFPIALIRTLCRFIPFEPFSYLGKGDGWHDKWQCTQVVKEEPVGLVQTEGPLDVLDFPFKADSFILV